MIHPSILAYLPQVQELLKNHKIKNACVFGSVLTNKFDEESDVDILVNLDEGLDPVEAGEHLWDLQDELKALLHREIDILTERSLKNPYFINELNETKVRIYG